MNLKLGALPEFTVTCSRCSLTAVRQPQFQCPLICSPTALHRVRQFLQRVFSVVKFPAATTTGSRPSVCSVNGHTGPSRPSNRLRWSLQSTIPTCFKQCIALLL